MKLTQLQEAKYAGPKNINNLLQFFVEQEHAHQYFRTFYVQEGFIVTNPTDGDGGDVESLTFADNDPDNVTVMHKGVYSLKLPVNKIAEEFIVFRQQRVY